jgi:hypothetical protein
MTKENIMHKKLITACLALVALAAFALPAMAQAANKATLTQPTGTPMTAGTKITGTNIGPTFLRSTVGAEQLKCTSDLMTGELTKNETGNVQVNISSATFNGEGPGSRCTGFVNAHVSPLGLGTGAGQGWCLKSNSTTEGTTDEFQVLGGKCTETAKKIKFLLLPETGGECEYESTSTIAARGTYTTDTTGDAIVTTPRSGHTPTEDAGFTKIRDTTPFSLCPSSSGLEMTFTLEKDEAIKTPIFISE